jgi:hypothetical protein
LSALDKISAIFRTFPQSRAGSKRIEELGGGIRTILPVDLFGLIHANSEMDSFRIGAVDFNYSLSDWQIGFKNPSDRGLCQISHKYISFLPVFDVEDHLNDKSVFVGRNNSNLRN